MCDCVISHGVDGCVVAWLRCFAKILCASHKNVSSVFRLADCTLEKQLLSLGLVSAGSNGFEQKRWFLQIRR